MKKTRRFMTAAMAAALAAILPMSAVAQTNSGATGGTSFGIVQTTATPANVSFELPLYVTMAVVSNDTAVVMPSDYKIKNLAATGGYDIKISGMEVEKLAGSTFSLTSDNNPDNMSKNQIYMKIGDAALPALTTEGTPTAVTLTGSTLETKQIAPDTEYDIALEGVVLGAPRTAADAAAQFKVTYTVSAVDTSGATIGGAYVGDSSSAAGF